MSHYVFPPARAYRLNRCLFALKSDEAFRRRYLESPEAALEAMGLAPEERAALRAGDRERLVALGAHPYLVFMARFRLAMEGEETAFEYF
jgi:hypothetical protein